MSDFPVKTPVSRDDGYGPDGLILDAEDEETLRLTRERTVERLRLLWSKRQPLLQAAVCGLVIATAIAFLIPKRYTSTAGLMPPDQAMGSGAAALAALSGRAGSGLASLAESALGVKTTGSMFIGILKSDTVQDDLIRKFDLARVYRTRYIEDTREELAKHTSLSEDQKSGLISIAVTDHDPRRATAMAQEYVNQLNWVVTHLSTSSAHRERVFLDQRLQQVNTDLEGAEKQFSQFASQKGAVDIPAQGKAMVTAAAQLQGELIAAQAELESFRQVYTDSNIRVRSLQARVLDLRNSLQKLAGKGAGENSSAKELFPTISQLPVLGVTYADLLRQTKVEEAVFEVLTREDELAKVQEAKEVPSVKVLDPPEVPQKKSFPPRALIVILGTMLAFVSCASWILARSAWNGVDPNDPRKALAIEIWSDLRMRQWWNNGNGSRAPSGWLNAKSRRSSNGDNVERRPEEAVEEQS